ncbi:hypothetical protein B0H16DRAFT_1479135 [Mycena metata]|uniref:Uncharacterized protein n=1 Tax=Mycena metata TaxID=1033252 RepID=A0AAD7H5A3_9AGAR|nr:hypothetical protein B0H16DRAFT_1479135 [Mycena metata]
MNTPSFERVKEIEHELMPPTYRELDEFITYERFFDHRKNARKAERPEGGTRGTQRWEERSVRRKVGGIVGNGNGHDVAVATASAFRSSCNSEDPRFLRLILDLFTKVAGYFVCAANAKEWYSDGLHWEGLRFTQDCLIVWRSFKILKLRQHPIERFENCMLLNATSRQDRGGGGTGLQQSGVGLSLGHVRLDSGRQIRKGARWGRRLRVARSRSSRPLLSGVPGSCRRVAEGQNIRYCGIESKVNVDELFEHKTSNTPILRIFRTLGNPKISLPLDKWTSFAKSALCSFGFAEILNCDAGSFAWFSFAHLACGGILREKMAIRSSE